MSQVYFEILLGFVILSLYLYYHIVKHFDFWKKRNVVGPKPVPFFGNYMDVTLGRKHLADTVKKIYDAYPDEPAIGSFHGTTPVLILRDADMIKEVLVKSFSSFVDRGINIHTDLDPLGQGLFNLDYKRWKQLRKKLVQSYSNKKLKDMFSLTKQCTMDFMKYLEKLAAKDEPLEFGKIYAKFTTEVTAVCYFGFNTAAMVDEDNEFYKMGKLGFANNWQNWTRLSSRALPHWLAILMIPFGRNNHLIKFFNTVVNETMAYRKQNNVWRNDFFDHLTDLKHDLELDESKDMLLISQAFGFFTAGVELNSSTISKALYELALNEEVQEKLREEVNLIFTKNQGLLSYDDLKDMKYLDKVVKEAVRKHPIGDSLRRKVTTDYVFTDKNISIPKETIVLIPMYALHYDPNIYPNPDKFDPERFNEEVVATRSPMHYLPFGEGCRKCIADRFALDLIKLSIAMTVHNFKIQVCEKTVANYEILATAENIQPKGGLYLRIKTI